MKSSILMIRIGGVSNALIAALHIAFWQLFDWQTELAQLSVVNSNIMQMLNLFTIVFLIYSVGMLLLKPYEMLTTAIGRLVLGMFATLYLARLAMEFYFPEQSLSFGAYLLASALMFIIPILKFKQYANQ